MRRVLALISAAIMAASCSVYTYTLNMEMRKPSDSGLELGGKTVSVAYLNPDGMDGESEQVATSLAQGLTDSYFDLDSVDVYRLKRGDDNWHSRDSLMKLVLDFNTDVVMVLDRSSLYIYDSMNKKGDKVYILKPSSQDYSKEFNMLLADRWAAENYSLYYADDYEDDWLDALEAAYAGNWKDAIDGWLPLVKKGVTVKCRAAAAYNLSVAFYMLDDYELSREWLDYCDKLVDMPLSAGMRSRIMAKTR